MTKQRKAEPAYVVGGGRIEELKGLEAGERALAEAWMQFACARADRWELRRVAELHRRHSVQLAWRIEALGGEPAYEPNDQWITNRPLTLQSLVAAEEQARLTYHDHLLDLDPESIELVRNRVLPEQERLVQELTGETEPGGYALVPG